MSPADGNNLGGTLIPELAQFSNLAVLDLQNHDETGRIQGRLPSELGLLPLGGIFLQGNQLTGTIPKELCRVTGLKYLELNKNSMTGTIPNCLASLTELRRLVLTSNSFSGSIPSQFGQLDLLDELRLEFNNLSGSVPVEIWDATRIGVGLELMVDGCVEVYGGRLDCSVPNCQCDCPDCGSN